MMKILVAFVALLSCILSAYGQVDPRFAVDPREVQWNEISQDIRKISGAVMGIAELVVEIKSEVSNVRKELGNKDLGRNEVDGEVQDDLSKRFPKYQVLANKLEKIFANDNSPELQVLKDDIRKTVEINFIRILSAMLVTGPMRTQDRQEDILKLMKTTLNGELDFSQVVNKLPFIMRDSETNQFISLLKTLKETEDFRALRQDEGDDDNEESESETKQPQVQSQVQNQVAQTPVQGTQTVAQGTQSVAQGTQPVAQGTQQQPATTMKMPSGLDRVLDAMGMLDIAQLAGFLSRIPEIFQGIETLVDGAETTFGNF